MTVETTPLPGGVLITPPRFADNRGDFCETYNAETLANSGIDTVFIQDNHSRSRFVGTVRGLHFQAPPKAQAKLVRVIRGRIFDVIVDIRVGSPHFGQWFGVELSEANGRQLLVPTGFLHGFVTREPDTEVLYKCSQTYSPAHEGAVRFDDPALNIDWGLDGVDAILSPKDAAAGAWRALNSPFTWEQAR
ncbi:dTDP-4-dehydrorhamnose 3,5-epimerase [Devosia limi DSM 17137]|uniref:dTDP-4-dehydrorhamnose 3,5-epimerase n=1 Tax=Devosia limi DSM 17137 TaxID=1121477 RepID=A0A0F5LGM5_9HYPH|nr:dTDP-4-dehydrorhamnose 3,5-epimerase [Devosia limi DSM 17137]